MERTTFFILTACTLAADNSDTAFAPQFELEIIVSGLFKGKIPAFDFGDDLG